MIWLLTLFDYLVLKDIDRRLHFYQLENDFIQIFSLGIFFPFIYVAFVLRFFLEIFKYPSQGIYVFKSFAGLTGLLALSIGLIMFFL
jgi:hypothetical protein